MWQEKYLRLKMKAICQSLNKWETWHTILSVQILAKTSVQNKSLGLQETWILLSSTKIFTQEIVSNFCLIIVLNLPRHPQCLTLLSLLVNRNSHLTFLLHGKKNYSCKSSVSNYPDTVVQSNKNVFFTVLKIKSHKKHGLWSAANTYSGESG